MHTVGAALMLAAATGLAVALYVRSLRLHPWRPCRRPMCKSGRRTDALWAYAWGPCRSCGGSGRRLRLGCRLLGIRP